MDDIAMMILMACILLSIGLQQQKAVDRVQKLEMVVAKIDTVFVVAMPDSIAAPPDTLQRDK